MAVENGTNWAPEYLITLNGITIPTYGMYGGPQFTGGMINPGVFIDVPALDPLDTLFKAHDTAYFTSSDTDVLAVADISLISEIAMLDDSQLGGEAHLYGAGAELALLYNVTVNYGRADLLTTEQTNAIVADALDHLEQASIDPTSPAEQDGVSTVLDQLAPFDLISSFDDEFAFATNSLRAQLTSPNVEEELSDAIAAFTSAVEHGAGDAVRHGAETLASVATDAVEMFRGLEGGAAIEDLLSLPKPGIGDFIWG
jgi:hypothetical protein